jgi:putative transposase
MKRKRHTPDQIIRKLREADAQLSAGATIADVSKKLGVSEVTFHRWRHQYGGMKVNQAKRLRDLERENSRLKKLVAEQALDIDILKEVSKGTSEPDPEARCGAAPAARVQDL